jgi:hypothetical protein
MPLVTCANTKIQSLAVNGQAVSLVQKNKKTKKRGFSLCGTKPKGNKKGQGRSN